MNSMSDSWQFLARKFEFQNDEAACSKKKFYKLSAACNSNKKKVLYLIDKSESQKKSEKSESQKVRKSEKVRK
jgi:hypothetical protein